MAFDLTWEPRGVWRRYHGTLTPGDLSASVDVVQRDERYDTLRYSINDFLAVENVADIALILDQVVAKAIGGAHSNTHLVMAIVARGEAVLSHARLFLMPDFPYPVRLFDNLDAARDWLRGL
jgi:hypothetical protein